MKTTCALNLLVTIFLSIACTDLECGPGTHRAAAVCVPNIPVACGEGTVYERGYCVVRDPDASDADSLMDVTSVPPDGGR